MTRGRHSTDGGSAATADGTTARRDPPQTGDAGVAALLTDAEPYEAVVEGDDEGPLAVVSDPYAGRERVLDHAVDRLDATRIRLDPGEDATRVRAALDDGGPVVVDDCQHLYRRVVGGFERLETALDLFATADATVVTGWNRYAWAYLTAVRTVEPVFPAVADVGRVEADRLAELVLAEYDDTPDFESDADDDGTVSVDRQTVEIRGRSLSIPVPTLNVTGRGERREDDESVDARDVVFERLAATADGNVGVASAIWERRRGDVVRPSDITVPGFDLAFDREETFCLRSILAKERIERSEVERLVETPDRVLARLVRNDIVSADEESVWLSPAAVPTAVEHAGRERIP